MQYCWKRKPCNEVTSHDDCFPSIGMTECYTEKRFEVFNRNLPNTNNLTLIVSYTAEIQIQN